MFYTSTDIFAFLKRRLIPIVLVVEISSPLYRLVDTAVASPLPAAAAKNFVRVNTVDRSSISASLANDQCDVEYSTHQKYCKSRLYSYDELKVKSCSCKKVKVKLSL
jgi:hypothetical protein